MDARKTRGTGKSITLMLFSGDSFNKQCWQFVPPTSLIEMWKIPIAYFHRFSSCCEIPEGIAFTGGEGSHNCVMLRMKNQTWKKMTCMLLKRYAHGSVFVKGHLFVFGGYVKGKKSKSVQCLNLQSGKWHQGPDLPIAVQYPEVVACHGDVYLLYPSKNLLFHLNTTSMSWSKKSPLPGDKGNGARMICIDDRLCVAGGDYKVHAWFTPSTDTWTMAAKPLFKHWYGAVLYQNKTIFLIGGHDLTQVESYSMETGVWSMCHWKMPKAIFDLKGLMLE